MIMEFILNEQKAQALGYPVQACYDVIDNIFAEHGILPEKLGFYRGPNTQATFNTCTNASTRLLHTGWFLHVVDEWYWRVTSDELKDREDCLASYYRVQAMHLIKE